MSVECTKDVDIVGVGIISTTGLQILTKTSSWQQGIAVIERWGSGKEDDSRFRSTAMGAL